LVYQYVKKNKTVPKCGQCKEKLKGIRPTRPCERSRISKRQKTVARTYGGVLCHRCVRERIVRAFLIEEQKVVKQMKSLQQAQVKKVVVAAPKPKVAAKAAPAKKTAAPAKKGAPAAKAAGKKPVKK